MNGFTHVVLARKAGEEGTQAQSDWGGEGNEVEVPSSPRCFRNGSPLLPFHGRRRQVLSAAAPGAVEVAFRVQALEAVGAEEIALGLDEIGGAAGLAIAVEVSQR
jgi:hypothetical protein